MKYINKKKEKTETGNETSSVSSSMYTESTCKSPFKSVKSRKPPLMKFISSCSTPKQGLLKEAEVYCKP